MKPILPLMIAVLASAGAVATAALADPVIAKLQAPLPAAAKPVAGEAVFECLGDVCAARAPTDAAGSLRGCKDLARQVGAVISFGASAKPLGADKIAECNQSARK